MMDEGELDALLGGALDGAGPAALTQEDRVFLRAFLLAELPESAFGHQAHVRAAWALLHLVPLARALDVYATSVQRLAAKLGKPGLYHATITWAYLFLIHERLEDSREAAWDVFARAHGDLLTWKPSILDRYYRPERLWSDRARRSFLMPDRGDAGPDEHAP